MYWKVAVTAVWWRLSIILEPRGSGRRILVPVKPESHSELHIRLLHRESVSRTTHTEKCAVHVCCVTPEHLTHCVYCASWWCHIYMVHRFYTTHSHVCNIGHAMYVNISTSYDAHIMTPGTYPVESDMWLQVPETVWWSIFTIYWVGFSVTMETQLPCLECISTKFNWEKLTLGVGGTFHSKGLNRIKGESRLGANISHCRLNVTSSLKLLLLASPPWWTVSLNLKTDKTFLSKLLLSGH